VPLTLPLLCPPPSDPPPLPSGRAIDLPGRGTTFVREVPGPRGAPTVMLLHGLAATADLNWFRAFEPLGAHFRVVTLDHRGHGRGIRSREPFRLSTCADDAVALADALGIDTFIPVGYSMGGPIAQLAWYRHPRRVEGMVLCATSRDFRGHPRERLMFGSLAAIALAARLDPTRSMRTTAELMLSLRLAGQPHARWALEELRRTDSNSVLQAAAALGNFTSREWVGEIDVPIAVVVTKLDRLVPVHRQVKLARAIPSATIHVVEGDHYVPGRQPAAFVEALVEACQLVARRGSAHRKRRAMSVGDAAAR
jgi:3-oxoadipate enol-lactonase